MRETSLDEFVGEADEAAASDGDDSPTDGAPDGAATESIDGSEPVAESEGPPAAEPPDDDAAVDVESEDPASGGTPAVSTFQWTPDGAACADCGETVDRRWRDGDELVCSACKPW